MTDIEKKIEDLRKTLRYHSERYYNDDAPEIEDYEYDMMMRELQQLEEKYPEFDSPDSPTKRVGGKADNSFASVAHNVRMESLQDAFSKEELYDFEKRVSDVVKGAKYCVEPKIDGLSVSLEYRDGLSRCAARSICRKKALKKLWTDSLSTVKLRLKTQETPLQALSGRKTAV